MQKRMRHASAKATLDVYGHMFEDRDKSTRTAIDAVMTARAADSADFLRTREGVGALVSLPVRGSS